MAITATSSVAPLPQLSALQAKQITDYTPVETTKKSISVAAYASPVYKFDPLAKLSIELIRDTSTGSVINQIPSQQVVQRYRLGQQAAGNAVPAGQNSTPGGTNAGVPVPAASGAVAAGGGAISAGGGASAIGSSVSIKV